MARLVSSARLVTRDFGTSLRFNASSAKVTIPGITPSTTNFNVAFWVYWPEKFIISSARRIVSWEDATNGGFRIEHLSANTGRCVFEILNGASAVASVRTPIMPVGWHMVAATYAVNNVNIYADSVLSESDTSATMAAPSGQTLTIGQSSTGVQPWVGFVDNFVFKNGTPWTQAEIDALYFQGTIPSGSTCVLKFDEGSGTTANDSSGNGNNGTIANATFSSFVPMKARTSASGRTLAGARTLA